MANNQKVKILKTEWKEIILVMGKKKMSKNIHYEENINEQVKERKTGKNKK